MVEGDSIGRKVERSIIRIEPGSDPYKGKAIFDLNIDRSLKVSSLVEWW